MKPMWMAGEWRQEPLDVCVSVRLQNVPAITVFALYSGCSKVDSPTLTPWHSSRRRSKMRTIKCSFLNSGLALITTIQILWLDQTFKLLFSEESFSSEASYNPHGSHFLLGPPHHYKQHAQTQFGQVPREQEIYLAGACWGSQDTGRG